MTPPSLAEADLSPRPGSRSAVEWARILPGRKPRQFPQSRRNSAPASGLGRRDKCQPIHPPPLLQTWFGRIPLPPRADALGDDAPPLPGLTGEPLPPYAIL